METYPTPESRLRDAKILFGQAMLENDTFFDLLQRREQSSDSAVVARDLPDFLCEPTYRPQEDGKIALGVQLKGSRQNELGEGMSIGASTRSHIDLAIFDRANNDLKFSANVTRDPAAAKELFGTWWHAWTALRETMGDEVALHPISYTLELRDEIERTAFSVN